MPEEYNAHILVYFAILCSKHAGRASLRDLASNYAWEARPEATSAARVQQTTASTSKPLLENCAATTEVVVSQSYCE